jgi:acetyl esterase/lipase
MSTGFLFTVLPLGICTAAALAAPTPTHATRSSIWFWLSYLVNELPFLVLYYLIGMSTLEVLEGDDATPLGWVAAAIAVATAVGLLELIRRALRTPGRQPVGVRRWARILLWPFPFPLVGVRRERNRRYGSEGRANLCDVYLPKRRPLTGPVFLHLHGGAFRIGGKSREARPLLQRLTRRGWLCVSANYRLGRAATFPDQLVDVKRAIAYARERARKLGADPDHLVIGGSSAGAHLAAIAALTPNDARFQPEFEDADTSVSAAVVMYAYYGSIASRGVDSSPFDYVQPEAPPFLVVHGDRDSIVPVGDARSFAARLRARSAEPVVYTELPGAQHDFDFFHSVRFEAVVDGVEAFTERVAERRAAA